MVLLCSITLFLSSALLFLVEPMFAKMVLPYLGGAPNVWNTCMLFFQVALLGGYAYAHVVMSRLAARRQVPTHLALLLLPLLVLPIGIANGWRPPTESSPVPSLLLLMLVTVGLPFFVLSTSSSVMQRWFSYSGHEEARDPYFLFVASNAGSLVGLLGYVALVEPNLTLSQQSLAWTWGYVAFVLLAAVCALVAFKLAPANMIDELKAKPEAKGRRSDRKADDRLTWPRRLRWIGLAFAPSSMTLGYTTSVSANLASVPLLWVVLLSLYLITFMLAFSRRRLVPQAHLVRLYPALVLFQMMASILKIISPLVLSIIQVVALFIGATVCHKELADDRPSPKYLTQFYLYLAVGGALGGAFNALVAPAIFTTDIEYPLVLALSVVLLRWPALGFNRQEGKKPAAVAPFNILDVLWPAGVGVTAVLMVYYVTTAASSESAARTALWIGVIAVSIACICIMRRPARFGLALAAFLLAFTYTRPAPTLFAARSFFGIHRVIAHADDPFHVLRHGAITHGVQNMMDEFRERPLTYFYPTGPLGQTMRFLQLRRGRDDVAVVGLGAGTIAAYAQSGQNYTFYEIDPVVRRVASDPEYFTYLTDATDRGANVIITMGDGRLNIAKAPHAGYDLIILDAFNGDAPPVHLLTRQAFRIYLSKLKPHGLIAVNISINLLDLRPVVANLAADAGMVCLTQNDMEMTPEENRDYKMPSRWAIMARDTRDFGDLPDDLRWEATEPQPGARVWTDEYSNILSLVSFRR